MTSPRNADQNESGFIVVAVLWILMALATLAAVYASYIGTSAVALSAADDRLQMEECVYASLALTAYQLSAPDRQSQPTRGGFRFRLAKANILVRFSSENSRIDLNAAKQETLAALFAVLGAKPEEANIFAQRVVGWRTRPKPDQAQREADYYQGLPYLPRGAPFNNVAELWLVAGLPPALVERTLNFVTLFSNSADVDPTGAAPEVIAALPGMTPGKLNAFLDQRETMASDTQLAATLGLPQRKGAVDGGAMRVITQVTFDKGTRLENESVIRTGEAEGAYRILSWQDKTDAGPDRGQTTGLR